MTNRSATPFVEGKCEKIQQVSNQFILHMESTVRAQRMRQRNNSGQTRDFTCLQVVRLDRIAAEQRSQESASPEILPTKLPDRIDFLGHTDG